MAIEAEKVTKMSDKSFLPLKFDKYGLTLIDHDNHTCVVISNVNREHSGFWSCELDSAMTHANLIIKTGEMSNPITQPTHYYLAYLSTQALIG